MAKLPHGGGRTSRLVSERSEERERRATLLVLRWSPARGSLVVY